MRSLKILILMAYYNRPILVKNALNSILKANENYKNWHLLFGDDGSSIPGRPIVEELLKDHLSQITFVNTHHTIDEKIREGLLLGKYANNAIKSSDADVAIMLCDDDELVPNYLTNLNTFFQNNPNVLYCYSKVHLYNPFFQKSCDVNNIAGKMNQWNDPIEPVAKVDASQVAWRLECCKKHGAWFGESTKVIADRPWTSDTDRSLFEQLSKNCGLCYPTGFVAQYKSVHDYQLLWHKNVSESSLREYDRMYNELAGVVF